MSDKLDKSLFEFYDDSSVNIEENQGESLSYWKDARIKFFKNKMSVIALASFIVMLMLAFTAPFMGAYHNEVYDANGDPYPNMIGDYQNLDYANLPPKLPIHPFGLFDGVQDGVDLYAEAGVPDDMYFYFGTDKFGRDLYVRVFVGLLVSLSYGFFSALISLLLGVSLGGASGYYGGKVDLVLQRVVEVLGSIPLLIWVILVVILVGTGMIPLLIATVIAGWIPMYRIVRAQTLKLKQEEYVLCSKTLGGSSKGIISKHIIPNMMGTIIIWIMFTIPSAIFFESFMSFLGLGISSPIPSLGSLANEGREVLRNQPYILFAPTLVLSLVMLQFNLMADGLRDAFDPKIRGGE